MTCHLHVVSVFVSRIHKTCGAADGFCLEVRRMDKMAPAYLFGLKSFPEWLPLHSFAQFYRELLYRCQISRGLQVALAQDKIPYEV